MRNNLIDRLVDDVAGLHHDHHAARRLQVRAHLLDRVATDHLGALRLIGEKLIDLRRRAVEDCHRVAVVVHVQNQILPHHGEADQTDIASSLCHFFSRFKSITRRPTLRR